MRSFYEHHAKNISNWNLCNTSEIIDDKYEFWKEMEESEKAYEARLLK